MNFKGLIFLLKQVCLQVQSFKTGMSNQQRENVLTYENFKELSGFGKFVSNCWRLRRKCIREKTIKTMRGGVLFGLV